jgi:hypothetical protein
MKVENILKKYRDSDPHTEKFYIEKIARMIWL